MSIVSYLDRVFYKNEKKNWVRHLFADQVRSSVPPGGKLLDLGAGRGRLRMLDYRRDGYHVVGVDVDEAILQNEQVDEQVHWPDSSKPMPFDDATFDVLCSHDVVEHMEFPVSAFTEIHRVLKPGGRCIIKTPNKFHYVQFIAAVTPHRFHKSVAKKTGRDDFDTFKTYYRCNSRSAVKKIAAKTGFEVEFIDIYEPQPHMARVSWLIYPFGILYERIVNLTSAFSGFRSTMVYSLRKPLSDFSPVESGD